MAGRIPQRVASRRRRGDGSSLCPPWAPHHSHLSASWEHFDSKRPWPGEPKASGRSSRDIRADLTPPRGGSPPDGSRCSTVVNEIVRGGALGTWQGELRLHRHSPPPIGTADCNFREVGDDATAPRWRPGPASRTATRHHRNLAQVVKIPTPKKLVAVHPGRR